MLKDMLNDMERIMYNKDEIAAMVKTLAEQISKDYAGRKLLMICVLKGASVFFTDLIREISIPVEIDFTRISSYGNQAASSGEVNKLLAAAQDIKGKNIILVEDIIDSGNSLSYMLTDMLRQQPAELKLCVLLNKVSRRETPVQVDYCGAEIPDDFVVGYGMDYAEQYRNMPVIGVLKPEIYGA